MFTNVIETRTSKVKHMDFLIPKTIKVKFQDIVAKWWLKGQKKRTSYLWIVGVLLYEGSKERYYFENVN